MMSRPKISEEEIITPEEVRAMMQDFKEGDLELIRNTITTIVTKTKPSAREASVGVASTTIAKMMIALEVAKMGGEAMSDSSWQRAAEIMGGDGEISDPIVKVSNVILATIHEQGDPDKSLTKAAITGLTQEIVAKEPFDTGEVFTRLMSILTADSNDRSASKHALKIALGSLAGKTKDEEQAAELIQAIASLSGDNLSGVISTFDSMLESDNWPKLISLTAGTILELPFLESESASTAELDEKAATDEEKIESAIRQAQEDSDGLQFTALADFLDEKKGELKTREANFVSLGSVAGALLTLASDRGEEYARITNAAIIEGLRETGTSPKIIAEVTKFLSPTLAGQSSVLAAISEMMERVLTISDPTKAAAEMIKKSIGETVLKKLQVDNGDEEAASLGDAMKIMSITESDGSKALTTTLAEETQKTLQEQITTFEERESVAVRLGLRIGTIAALASTKGPGVAEMMSNGIFERLREGEISQNIFYKVLKTIPNELEKMTDYQDMEAIPAIPGSSPEHTRVEAAARSTAAAATRL